MKFYSAHDLTNELAVNFPHWVVNALGHGPLSEKMKGKGRGWEGRKGKDEKAGVGCLQIIIMCTDG